MTHNPSFHWAAGIENTFIPQAAPGLRPLEEYELTQHYRFWREDIDRAADLGISHIRWGIPWYRVAPAPGRFDWAWVDEVLDHMVVRRGVMPILDLMHYGTPLWLEGSFLHPDYPQHVADYAHAVAARYGDLIQDYTPLNEPWVTADRAGRHGEWPPYRTGDDGFVAVLVAVLRGMALTGPAVRAADPDARFVQVEALAWHWPAGPDAQAIVDRHQAHAYLPFDLYTGRVDEAHPLYGWLLAHGATEDTLAWLRDHATQPDVLGVNLYPWSGGAVSAGGARHGELTGARLADVLRDAHARYGLPMMVTETSARRDVAGRALWMDETIAAVAAARADGLPVIGYTWFPVMTMIDWAYRLTTAPLAGYLLHLGLWDSAFNDDGTLIRHETPLVEKYRAYVAAGAPQM